MISSGLARLHDLLEHPGRSSLDRRDLAVDEQDVGVGEDRFPAARGSVTKVGREVALVELHALDEVEPRCRTCFDSSTVTTPSLPTLSMASAMTSPIFGSAAEIERDLGRSRTCRRRPWPNLAMGLDRSRHRHVDAPLEAGRASRRAATLRRPFGRTSAWASTVAVVVAVTGDVVGLGGDLLDQLGPPCSRRGPPARSRERSTHRQLVIVGAPNFLSSTTLRPLGAERDP